MIETKGSGKQRVFSALSVGLVVEAINKISPLFMITLAQRRLGLESFGYAQFIISLIELTIPLMVFGYTYYGAVAYQQTRNDLAETQKLVTSILMLRLMHAIGLALVLIVALLLIPAWQAHTLVLLAMFPLILMSACELTFVNYGAQRMTRLSLWVGLYKLLSLAGIYFIVKEPDDALLYAALTIGTGSLVALTSFVWVVHQIGLKRPKFSTLKETFRKGLFFAPVVLLYPLLQRFDLVVAETFVSSDELGLYSAPWRLALSLFPLFYVVTNTFFSESLIAKDNTKLRRNVVVSQFICLAIAAPIAAAMPFVGDNVLVLLFGANFIGYGSLLAIFCTAILIDALLVIYTMQVLVVKRQILKLTVLFVATIVLGSTMASLAATSYGMYGIATAAVVCRLMLCLALILAVKPHIGWPVFSHWLYIALASCCMVAVLFMTSGSINLWAQIVTAGCAYCAVLVVTTYKQWARLLGKAK